MQRRTERHTEDEVMPRDEHDVVAPTLLELLLALQRQRFLDREQHAPCVAAPGDWVRALEGKFSRRVVTALRVASRLKELLLEARAPQHVDEILHLRAPRVHEDVKLQGWVGFDNPCHPAAVLDLDGCESCRVQAMHTLGLRF